MLALEGHVTWKLEMAATFLLEDSRMLHKIHAYSIL